MTIHDNSLKALLQVARDAIAAHLKGTPYTPPPATGPATQPHGAFVTLYTAKGDLRGCIGHIEPVYKTLVEEVASCAVASATQDPRFPPVAFRELSTLFIEISVLEPPEPITNPSQLDPRRYGVVVTAGKRRGVLLPDLEGVDTVEMQINIACRKAGIHPSEPLGLQRFRVAKVSESEN